jgi:hypothetical protein
MPLRCGGGLDGPHRKRQQSELPGLPPDRADHQLLSDQLHRHIADNLTLQPENINVRNSACGTSINVGAVQNALTVNVVPVPPQP